MRKALKGLPELDRDALAWRLRDWSPFMEGPGNNRVVVEWCVTNGPCCFVYPASRRAAGFDLAADASHASSDERWADFLEYTFVPAVVQAIESAGFNPQVICADQRPVIALRQRRRDLERIAQARGAGHGH
ncbi:MAG: hypothetical protein ACKO5K_02065 [Armatimonadota bacterium]